MSEAVIYRISHAPSGKNYVGSTSSWKRRQAEHRSALRGGSHCNRHLQNAWKKHGEPAFEFAVLEILKGVDNLILREQYWIDTLGAAESGFNLCPAAGTVRGRAVSPETRAKISAANTGCRRTDEAKARIRGARATQVHSREALAKMWAANTGQLRSVETRQKIAAAHLGKTLTEETRRKLRDANLGRKASPETRAKQSAALKLRVWTPESRAKASATRMGTKLSPESIAKRQATRAANAAAKKASL